MGSLSSGESIYLFDMHNASFRRFDHQHALRFAVMREGGSAYFTGLSDYLRSFTKDENAVSCEPSRADFFRQRVDPSGNRCGNISKMPVSTS